MIMVSLLSALLVGAPAEISVAVPDAPPSALSNANIAAHNAALDKADPGFIRCRRVDIPGSLVRKARVCKTNSDWAKMWRDGNQNARDTYDAMNRGSSNSAEPADEFTKRSPQPN